MSSLKITIRCANQANEDLKIDGVKSDWSVRQLKIYLADIHPLKPAPERQRIVFAGQLLRDEVRLAEYFQRYENTESHVLHLVYTSSIEDNVAAAERRAKKETELRQRKPNAAASTTSTTNEQRQENLSSVPMDASNSYSAQYWPWMTGQQVQFGATPDVVNDWMRQQQQMYATMNMMMSQWYGQYMQAAYGVPTGFYPATPVPQPNAAFGNFVPQQQQPEPVVQQQDVPVAQAQPQQAMNAQGGIAPADMDEDERNRDWLDYVYMACRASLLLMILYFYSSIERFVFVVLCCTLMYGLQAGWFGRRGQQQQQDEQQPQRGAAEADANRQRPAAGPDQQNPTDQQQPQDQEQPAVRNATPEETPTAWNVFWTTCWTFISSFFASLVPERPPPLNM